MAVCFSNREGCGSLWMNDGYHSRPIHVGNGAGHLLHFNQKPLLIKPSCKCEERSKGSESYNVFSDWHNAIQKDNRAQSREQRVFHLPLCHPQEEGDEPLCHPQEEWDDSLHNESEAFTPVQYLYKIQGDHPNADQGGHPPRSLGSLTEHHVSILPHPNSRDALLFSPL